jgi:hypothetical protein
MAPLSDSAFCFAHSPSAAPKRAKARQAGGRARAVPRLFEVPTEPVPLRAVADVVKILEQVTAETLCLRPGADRSRAIGSLLLLALKALETGELENRIAALEERVNTGPRRIA